MRIIFTTLCWVFTISTFYGQCEDSSNNWIESWTSCSTSANPNAVRNNSHWILYEFESPHYITTSHIWNANRTGESGKGLKDVIIDYSIDGTTWVHLGNYTFTQGTENDNYLGEAGPDFGNQYIQKILITVVNNHDGGSCVSLAEIQFTVDSNKCHGIVDVCGECNGPGAGTWFIDADGDGQGSPNSVLIDCDQPFGYVSNDNDICDSGELGWAEISPLFEMSCNGCHIEASAGGLSLSTYDDFLLGGNICGTDLKTGNKFVSIVTVNAYNGCGNTITTPSMNQRTGRPLTTNELNKIQLWIDGGAPEICMDYCLEVDNITQSFFPGDAAYRQVAQEISSISMIDTMTRIIFDAGHSIELNPGFMVKMGGVFTTKLEGCNDN